MDGVDAAVAALAAGDPVILPTDTVYGLCAGAALPEAVGRLSALKGRPPDVPIAVLAADVGALLAALPELDERSRALCRALLPGPLTLVLPNPGRRFPWLAGSRGDTIGARAPRLPAPAQAVLEQAGLVAATSANRHGAADPRTLDEVPQPLRDACGAVLDGGALRGVASTVLDVTGEEPRVLREGAVPAAEVLARVRALAG